MGRLFVHVLVLDTCISGINDVIMCVYRLNNVQIPKPVMTGHLSCQAAFAPQQGRRVIAG